MPGPVSGPHRTQHLRKGGAHRPAVARRVGARADIGVRSGWPTKAIADRSGRGRVAFERTRLRSGPAPGPRESASPVHARVIPCGAHRWRSCRARASQRRGLGADRLREPAAAGGRASVSEGSDAAGSDLGVRLPVGAPYDSLEGVRCREVTQRPTLMVAVAASAGKMDFEATLSCGASPRLFPLKFLILRPCVGLT